MFDNESVRPFVHTLSALDRAIQQQKWRKVVDLSNQVISDPKSSKLSKETMASVYLNRGFALRRIGSKREAIEDFLKASKLNPANFKPHLNAGLILAQDFVDYPEGLKEFDKAFALNPTNTEVLSSRGLIKMLMDDLEGAEKDLRTALSIDPNCVDALCNFGNLYSQKMDYEEAAEIYKKALDIAPNDHEIRYNLALALHKMGSHRAADSVLRQDKKALREWENRSSTSVERGIPWHLFLFIGIAVVLALFILFQRFFA
jgi:tetratricopeptide (TPR) repeat protein